MRQLVAACAALAMVTMLMPSADASRDRTGQSGRHRSTLGRRSSSDFADEHFQSRRGRTDLYFQSGRPGGYGAVDIYVASRTTKDLPWNVPVNLGPAINTASFELAPALSRDGHYLLFVSPRATGSADIYVSYREHVHDDFAWEAPTMLEPNEHLVHRLGTELL